MISRSNHSLARSLLKPDASRRRRLGKQLHRKAIVHFWATVPAALLVFGIFRGPLGIGAAGLVVAFAAWRYLVNRRRLDFLEKAPITLGESVLSKLRLKRRTYRIVMSYTFEGRRYSSQQTINQADHAAVLRREIGLYALFDRRHPGKMLSYRAGSVIPRWLQGRAVKIDAYAQVIHRPHFRQLRAEEREEVRAKG